MSGRSAVNLAALAAVIGFALGALMFAGRTPVVVDPRPGTGAAPAPGASPTLPTSGPCPLASPELGLPEGAGCVSQTSGDFDGDGTHQDRFVLYTVLDEDALPTVWRMRVSSDVLAPVDQVPGIGGGTTHPEIIGAEDADADGRDEVFVRTVTHLYHSGGTREMAIFGLDDEGIFRAQRDGEKLEFQIGGVSTFGNGAECRDVDRDGDPEFLLLRVDYVSSPVQRTSERIYEWRDRHLVFSELRKDRFAKTGYPDPILRRYYEFACLGFDPPFPY